MATIHVDSNAGGANNGTSWTDAYTTLQAGMTAATPATDIIWLASDHAEATSAIILSSTATQSDPLKIYSVSSADDSFTRAPAAQISDSGILRFTNSIQLYGVYLKGTTKIDMRTGGHRYEMESCTLELTGAGSTINIGATYCVTLMRNTDIKFATGANSSYFYWRGGKITIIGGTITGIAASAAVFNMISAIHHEFTALGTDMSSLDVTTNSSPLVGFDAGTGVVFAKLAFCSIPASMTIRKSNTDPEKSVWLSSVDDGGSLHRHEYHGGEGNVISTTVTYRDSGYQDKLTNTQISHKMTPASIVGNVKDLDGNHIIGHVTETGSKTITLEIAHNYTTALKDNEMYFDICSVDTTGEVLAAPDTTYPVTTAPHKDWNATGSTLTTSTESWTGASGYTLQKISKTITFNRAGPFIIIPRLGKYEAAKVVHYDAQVSIV